MTVRGSTVFLYQLLTAFALFVHPASSQDRVQMIVKAENHLSDGDTTSAIEVYKETIHLFPQSFVATRRLAEIYYDLEDYYHAILYTNIALDVTDNHLNQQDSIQVKNLRHWPQRDLEAHEQKTQQYLLDKADAHHLKGLVRLKQLRYEQAIEELDKARAIDSANYSLYMDKATVLTEIGKHEEARENLYQAVKDPMLQNKARFNLGNLYYREKKLDSALHYYNMVIDQNPLFKLAYQYKGLALTEQRRYQEAALAYTRYIQLDDQSEEIYFRRAVLYNELGQLSKALGDWTKVLELNPDNQEAWRNRGLTWFQKAEYEKSVNDFDHAIELAPDQSYTRINRGYAYYLLNQPDKALTDLNKGIEQMPKYYLGRYFRALVQLQMRNKKEACRDVKKAIDLGMKESDIDDILLKKCF